MQPVLLNSTKNSSIKVLGSESVKSSRIKTVLHATLLPAGTAILLHGRCFVLTVAD